jgi:hypothetical protein
MKEINLSKIEHWRENMVYLTDWMIQPCQDGMRDHREWRWTNDNDSHVSS